MELPNTYIITNPHRLQMSILFDTY